MNNFRALSESRFFIGTGLLLLLLSLLAPVCEASFTSQDGQAHSQQGAAHQHTDSLGMDLSHSDKTVHHCCTNFGAEKRSLVVALLAASVIAPDAGEVLQDLLPLNRSLFVPVTIPSSHHFRFNATGLPRYLITQRLRV